MINNFLLFGMELSQKYHFLIIEVFSICILVLFVSIILVNHKFNASMENVYYRRFCVAVLSSIVIDFINYICETTESINIIWFNAVVNALYLSVTMVIVVEWSFFVIYKFNPDKLQNKLYKILFHLPVITHTILSFVSIFTGWLFYIDDNGIYQRGPLFILQMTPWLYFLASNIYCITKFFDKKTVVNLKLNLSLLAYAIFPMIAEIFQLTGVGVPSISIGYTIGTIYTYMVILEDNISYDGLTGLNNRSYFLKHLSSSLKNLNLGDNLYLYIFDANDFKKINDTYGHIEGDKALKIMANVLKQIGSEYNGYVARFGGDEFVMLTDRVNENNYRDICKKINDVLHDEVINNKLVYDLVFSCGFAKCYPNDINDLNKLIARADGELYVDKGLYKNSINASKGD